MLGDNSEKSKNPLKKAMRRRNAKTVNFAAPTYIEASDVEYSTDEDDERGDFFNDDETVESEDGEAQEQNEDIVVEPLRPKAQKEKPLERAEGVEQHEKQESERTSLEPRRSSEDSIDTEGKQLDVEACSAETDPRTRQKLWSAGPGMALFGTRIPSSRMTLRSRRRYL